MNEPVVVYEPSREVLPAPHSLEENEEVIRQGLGTFVEVGNALMEIRDSRQYIAAGFDTFESYCREQWEMAKATVSATISSAKVVGVLEVRDRELLPASEWVARPLAKLLNEDGEEAVRNAWSQIVDAHDGDGPVSGKEVRNFLNPNIASVAPSNRPMMDTYLSALDKLKPSLNSVRWALEQHAHKPAPKQVRERYELYAETTRALADAMDALAAGEPMDRARIHEMLDVGLWER